MMETLAERACAKKGKMSVCTALCTNSGDTVYEHISEAIKRDEQLRKAEELNIGLETVVLDQDICEPT